MLRATINYQSHSVEAGLTILQAVSRLGIDVPTLCHDQRLAPIESCRLCLVNVEGLSDPVPACNTRLVDGMIIETHPPEIETLRRTLLGEMLDHYPQLAVQLYPEKPFHRLLAHYGLADQCTGAADPVLVDASHPYIHVDMSRCITCYRCVRICAELQGQFVWKARDRGDATRIFPDPGESAGTTLRESSCVSCGACVDTCPSGALEDATLLDEPFPSAWRKTTCPYCGTGCEMEVGTRDGKMIAVRPVLGAPVSKGHLCVKGRYAFDFVYSDDRVTTPLIRDGDAWREATWEEAIAFAALKMQQIVERHGPDAIGVLGSARATNEENYLAQKFARAVLGTNNVDCCARVCHAPTAAAMKAMLGTGAATNSFDDIEAAQTILICGCNPTENHPIVGARIKQAALKGANLIIIDPRRIELTEYAALHLALRPGTNIPLLNAMAGTIIQERLVDETFLAERVAGFDDFQQFIQAFSPEIVEDVCGVPAALIRRAARLYATAKPALSVHGLGVTEHTQGTEGVKGLVNLALLTGNIGRVGAGINPLRGQNNVQGSAHMGCEPGNLTGFVAINDGRDRFERAWSRPVPKSTGLNLLQMMDAADEGKLKGLWAIGYDILFTNANAATTRAALKNLDLVIVQDLFFNETAREFGTVFFPACSSFEKDGTFMNAERRVQRVRKAIEPIGGTRSDWEIICEVAAAMGAGDAFDYESAEEIWEEVREVWPAGRGITYERIEEAGLQWPCPTESHPGTTLLHEREFPIGQRAALSQIEFHSTHETRNEQFPFLLTTGRTLYQFNAGTMTMRTRNAELRPSDYLDMTPADAVALELAEGDHVRVYSRYGACTLPVRITTAVKDGELFATFHDTRVFLNNLTSSYRDGMVGTPEYKITAVRLEKV